MWVDWYMERNEKKKPNNQIESYWYIISQYLFFSVKYSIISQCQIVDIYFFILVMFGKSIFHVWKSIYSGTLLLISSWYAWDNYTQWRNLISLHSFSRYIIAYYREHKLSLPSCFLFEKTPVLLWLHLYFHLHLCQPLPGTCNEHGTCSHLSPESTEHGALTTFFIWINRRQI